MAEEWALNAILERAQALLETRGRTVDLSDAYEKAFLDTGFEFLLVARLDGIEESELADHLRMANLGFDDWFTPLGTCPTSIRSSRTRSECDAVGENDRGPRRHLR